MSSDRETDRSRSAPGGDQVQGGRSPQRRRRGASPHGPEPPVVHPVPVLPQPPTQSTIANILKLNEAGVADQVSEALQSLLQLDLRETDINGYCVLTANGCLNSLRNYTQVSDVQKDALHLLWKVFQEALQKQESMESLVHLNATRLVLNSMMTFPANLEIQNHGLRMLASLTSLQGKATVLSNFDGPDGKYSYELVVEAPERDQIVDVVVVDDPAVLDNGGGGALGLAVKRSACEAIYKLIQADDDSENTLQVREKFIQVEAVPKILSWIVQNRDDDDSEFEIHSLRALNSLLRKFPDQEVVTKVKSSLASETPREVQVTPAEVTEKIQELHDIQDSRVNVEAMEWLVNVRFEQLDNTDSILTKAICDGILPSIAYAIGERNYSVPALRTRAVCHGLNLLSTLSYKLNSSMLAILANLNPTAAKQPIGVVINILDDYNGRDEYVPDIHLNGMIALNNMLLNLYDGLPEEIFSRGPFVTGVLLNSVTKRIDHTELLKHVYYGMVLFVQKDKGNQYGMKQFLIDGGVSLAIAKTLKKHPHDLDLHGAVKLALEALVAE